MNLSHQTRIEQLLRYIFFYLTLFHYFYEDDCFTCLYIAFYCLRLCLCCIYQCRSCMNELICWSMYCMLYCRWWSCFSNITIMPRYSVCWVEESIFCHAFCELDVEKLVLLYFQFSHYFPITNNQGNSTKIISIEYLYYLVLEWIFWSIWFIKLYTCTMCIISLYYFYIICYPIVRVIYCYIGQNMTRF